MTVKGIMTVTVSEKKNSSVYVYYTCTCVSETTLNALFSDLNLFIDYQNFLSGSKKTDSVLALNLTLYNVII